MAGSARERSMQLVAAAALAALGAAAAGVAGPRRRGPVRDGVDGPGGTIRQSRRRWRPRPDAPEPDGTPVKPNRPLDLSGGAAAALEFDD